MMHEKNDEALYVRRFLRSVYVTLVSRVDILEFRTLDHLSDEYKY